MKRIIYLLILLGFHITAWSDNCNTEEHFKCFGINWQNATAIDIQKIDIHLKNKEGSTPLHYAARYASPEVIALLLEKGADIETIDKNGSTPLHKATFNNANPAATALLLENGADIEAREGEGLTPLHNAARYANPEIIALLLEKGADVNARGEKGELTVTVPGVVIVGSVYTFYSGVFEPQQKENSKRSIEECLQVLINLDRPVHNNNNKESTQ